MSTSITEFTLESGDTIDLIEKNRATVFVNRDDRAGGLLLQKILHQNYLSKGVDAVLVGIGTLTRMRYAIFVEDEFFDQHLPQ